MSNAGNNGHLCFLIRPPFGTVCIHIMQVNFYESKNMEKKKESCSNGILRSVSPKLTI